MVDLHIHRGWVKRVGAWLLERLGHLKPNGQLRGHSPLSRLDELEGLYIGITGKMQMWKVLEQTSPNGSGEFDFARLAERAALQRSKVEILHREAAVRAFGTASKTRPR